VPCDAKKLQLVPFRQTIKISLANERGLRAGNFGWCVQCRDSANFYTRNERVAVCSARCKLRHKENLQFIAGMEKEFVLVQGMYLSHAIELFECVCRQLNQLSDFSAFSEKEQAALQLKEKSFLLEVIAFVFENLHDSFLPKTEAIRVIREVLCLGLLKTILCSQKELFFQSFKIFLTLALNFREFLLKEIQIFINEIFLKVLESLNATFFHRSLALQVFEKIMQDNHSALEYYAYYDCAFENQNVL